MGKRVIALVLGAVALAIPTAAAADPGHSHGQLALTVKAKSERTGKAKKVKTVMFVFRGSFTAPGTVAVVAGNAQARKGGFVGQLVSFDFSSAKVVADDSNGDSVVNVSDVKDGDLVLVQARLPKGTKFAVPAAGSTPPAIVARKVIDKTNASPAPDEPAA